MKRESGGRYSLKLSLVLGVFISIALGEAGARADKPQPASPPAKAGRSAKGVVGIATYYAKRHEGLRTTSGETYRSEELTAAHPSAPLGSLVRVLRLETGKEVVVRVNDRCRRKRRSAVIDLSTAAARELGILGKGKVKVRIIPFEREDTEHPPAEVSLRRSP